jgi:hypothetical protein
MFTASSYSNKLRWWPNLSENRTIQLSSDVYQIRYDGGDLPAEDADFRFLPAQYFRKIPVSTPPV